MANIITSVEHGLEVAAADVLKAIPFIQKYAASAVKAEPQVVAALGVLLGAVANVLSSADAAVAQPFNISFDVQTVSAIKAVWPEIEAFAKSIGIKF